MYEHAKQHEWPVAGGVIQQSHSFLSFYRLMRSHEARLRSTDDHG